MQKDHRKEDQGIYDKSISPDFNSNFVSKLLNNVVAPLAPFINSRVKRADDDETLVEATAKGDYTYWLSQEDIADIARIEYGGFRGRSAGGYAAFDVIGSLAQLSTQIAAFKIKAQLLVAQARLTCIINLTDLAMPHWVSLVICYQDGGYVAYYMDSKDRPLPDEYRELIEQHFGIRSESFSFGFPQQSDGYNCGLWALENAEHINQMLEFHESINWLINEFKFPRDRKHFEDKRRLLAEKLSTDPDWRQRHPLRPRERFFPPPIEPELPFPLDPITHERKERPFFPQRATSAEELNSDNDHEPDVQPKRKRLQKDPRKLREVFVEAFLAAFLARLGAYHLAVKEKRVRLTTKELFIELTKGAAGALLGLGIAQSIVGMIPSLAASTRELSGKFYLPNKAKAQKIIKVFSTTIPDNLNHILAETAVAIFNSFESQFMQVTDMAGDQVAMEKLAEDAMDRALNYIEQHSNEDVVISKELLEQGVLQGPSEKFFAPSFAPVRFRTSGRTLQDSSGNKLRTAHLYKKVGIRIADVSHQSERFYIKKELMDSNEFGYRRPLAFEQEENGELQTSLREHYLEAHAFQPGYFPQETTFQFNSREYDYVLGTEAISQVAQDILTTIHNRFPVVRKTPLQKKQSVLFNLREAIPSFTGRVEALQELHRLLLSKKMTAVVPALSALTLHPNNENPLHSSAQVSVTGLGGIGKTQLALRYAQLHAADYDHNVLWINAETQENIDSSFRRLGARLGLRTKDRYDQDLDIFDIVATVYEYFSDRKSLFIFDNVENYRAIEAYFPKIMRGNRPILLITSRYSHWHEIASVLSLDVFTERESEELIKRSLAIYDRAQDDNIRELNQLLQGLPLALQQALAYIKQNRNAHFFIREYIERYKVEREKLLKFELVNSSNDPYLETVFTTWQLTLAKIRSIPDLGEDAIEVLRIMAFLNPDNISHTLFFHLENRYIYMESQHLAAILHLLRSYSMISAGNQASTFAIHRLVQQVIRINLKNDRDQFTAIVQKTEKLLLKYGFSEANDFHLMHFLLYMSEHVELKLLLLTGESSKVLFNRVLFKDIKYWTYFLELAHLNFPKEKYLRFLGDALVFYIKNTEFLFLFETLTTIETKWKKGSFSKENVKYILRYLRHIDNPFYKVNSLSRIPEKKERQKKALRFIDLFKKRIFENDILYDICPAFSLKRSINRCLSTSDEAVLKREKEQVLTSHIKKIGQVSNWISSGLMSKATLSSLLQGDFASVAVNFALIAGSKITEKLSNAMLTQGEELASDEVTLLTKELSLENKAALSLLLNNEVLSVGKRRFLGKAMQVVSPFMRRGTSIFFAYNLGNEIKSYQQGHSALLPDIISNGVIVGVDGLEAGIEGAEFLGVITGISEVTGPLGEAIATLVWLGVDVYEAKQQVDYLEKFIHLSRKEEFIQGLRAFFYMSPSAYLEVKIDNQLVQRALDFLKLHTEIKRYVFPTFRAQALLHDNSGVFLDKERALVVDNDNPDNPREGQLFCVSGALKDTAEASRIAWVPLTRWPTAPSKTATTTYTYLCQHAIGVAYSLNRTGDLTFISLAQGYDKAVVANFSSTLFLIEGGVKNYQGSDQADLFIVAAGNLPITGFLQGNKGTDTLILDSLYAKQSDYLLLDQYGFLCEKKDSDLRTADCEFNGVRIREINHLYGRKNQREVIYVDESMHFMDGRSGKEGQPDVFVLTLSSYKNPQFVLRKNTGILFSLNAGIKSVDYRIPNDETGEAWVQFHFSEATQHRFFFECSLQEVKAITIDDVVKFSLFTHISDHTEVRVFQLVLADPWFAAHLTGKNITEFPAKNVSYFFQGLEIKLLNENQLYAQEIEEQQQTMDEKLTAYVKVANQLGKSFSIQLIDNTTIVIGQKKQEVFYINTLAKSHVIGNGGEDVYIAVVGNDSVFPLPEMILYDVGKEMWDDTLELANTLDLRSLIKKIKQICPAIREIAYGLFTDENDLVFTINIPFYFLADRCIPISSSWTLATIRLKNALLDNGYERLDIFLEDNIARNIILTDDEIWTLTEMSLVVSDNKKLVLLTTEDLGKKPEILLLHTMGNVRFFQNGTDLIITNILSLPADYWTLIFYQFYQNRQMREKVLSSTLDFFEENIHLQDHQEDIHQAANFSDAIAAMVDAIEEVSLSPGRPLFRHPYLIPDVVNDDFLTSNRRRTQQKFPMQWGVPQPIGRSKRQVAFYARGNKTHFFNESIAKPTSQNPKPQLNLSVKYQVTAYENFFLAKWFLFFLGGSSFVKRLDQAEQQMAQDMSDLDWAEQHLKAGIKQFG